MRRWRVREEREGHTEEKDVRGIERERERDTEREAKPKREKKNRTRRRVERQKCV